MIPVWQKRARGSRAWWALVGALAVTSCTPTSYVELPEWTLRTEDGKTFAIRAPQHFEDRLPKHPADYVLETDVSLPEALRGRILTLTWPTWAFATLSIDGERILPLYIAPFDRSHPSCELVFRIPATKTSGEKLHLELQARHVDIWTTRFWQAPRLADAPYGERQMLLARYIDSTLITGLAAIFLLLALAAAVSFLLDRRRTADGWYALLTFNLAVWHLADLGITQLVDSRDTVHVALVTTPVTAIAAIRFTSAHFRVKPPRVVPLIMIALAVASVIHSWGPFANFSPALDLSQSALALLTVSAMLVRLARQRERRIEALSLIGACLLLATAAVMQDLHQALTYVEAVPLAWLVFVATQGILLLRQHAQELRSLNVALEGRVVTLEERNLEVSRLNEELRRQIHDRSARLAEAIGRIGRLSAGKSAPLVVGSAVGDRYKVVRVLGQGGMGAVYEVERTTDGTRLALKALLTADSGAWLARLAREAQAGAAVTHPNVVSIVDIDVDDSGMPFIVMELVDGEPLSARKARFGDPSFAREVVQQIAAGLAALHEAGIVHRDLKPANVLLERRSGDSFCAKIVDFGIARVSTGRAASARVAASDGVLDTSGFIPFVLGEHDGGVDVEASTAAPIAALTQTGWLLGTPLYMAPELSGGVKDASPSCDLWSLGVLAYQLGCGKLPFTEPPANWAAGGVPAPINLHDLPEPLRGVVERCLAVDPARRPTAAEVVAALT
jgi:hypothetical protein